MIIRDFAKFKKGVDKETPFVIFAALLARAIGDFAIQSVVTASIKCAFQHATLITYHIPDRDYKASLIRSNKYIDMSLVGTEGSTFPIELFDINSGRMVFLKNQKFQDIGGKYPDLVLIPAHMRQQTLNGLPNIASLSLPEDLANIMLDRFVELGLDPDRWFCVLHLRDGSYSSRPKVHIRDVPTAPYIAATRHIIEQQGGQVVRLGHHGSLPFPDMPGLIDLSVIPDSFDMQLYAITRARYMLAGPSGIAQLGSSFKTPTAAVMIPNQEGVWNSGDLILGQHLISPHGQRVPLSDSVAAGMRFEPVTRNLVENKGWRLELNSDAEMLRVSDMMFERTSDIKGWREPSPDKFDNTPNTLSLPLGGYDAPLNNRAQFIEFPDLWREAASE
jgi:putative glycosyltransferase (TIGR04372 family)